MKGTGHKTAVFSLLPTHTHTHTHTRARARTFSLAQGYHQDSLLRLLPNINFLFLSSFLLPGSGQFKDTRLCSQGERSQTRVLCCCRGLCCLTEPIDVSSSVTLQSSISRNKWLFSEVLKSCGAYLLAYQHQQ